MIQLFKMELRRAILDALVLTLSVLGVAMLFSYFTDRFAPVREIIGPVLFVLFFLLPMSAGFVTAERAFSRNFQERHCLFLYSLPLSRSRAWLALLAARLVGTLMVLAPLGIPAALLVSSDSPGIPAFRLAYMYIAAAILFLAPFAATSCFALVFKQFGAASLTAIGAIIVAHIPALLAQFISLRRFTELQAQADPGLVYNFRRFAFWSAISIPFSLFLALSARFFVVGEFNFPRSTVEKMFLLAICYGGVLLVISGLLAFFYGL